jgi:hypothetical protein
VCDATRVEKDEDVFCCPVASYNILLSTSLVSSDYSPISR